MMTPQTEAELSDAIKSAAGSLKIIGGGTRPIGNVVTGDLLSTSKMSGINLYEPGALTMVVQAGTPMADVEAALAAENQRLPFEPMDHRGLLATEGVPTIGGVVAANVSGPARIQAGACRDSLIGVRFVDGSGTAIKNGGRVMKNVTGYDLVKLMAGSYGTLGVLSEVSFKVLPADASRAVVMIAGQTAAGAVTSMSTALGSPFEVSGAAYLPTGMDGQPLTVLRVEGFADSVRYRSEQLTSLLENDGDVSVETDPDASVALWDRVKNVDALHGGSGDIWRCSIKPSDAAEFVSSFGQSSYQLDWGGGLVWLEVPSGKDVRAVAPHIAGHRTLMKADTATKAKLGVFHPEDATLRTLSQGLRERFDPRGILNPGLMG